MSEEKMTEAFMDMAGRVSQQLEQTENTLQIAIRMLEDYSRTPYLGDYDADYNRQQEVNDFIQQHKYVPKPIKEHIADPDNDDLPF